VTALTARLSRLAVAACGAAVCLTATVELLRQRALLREGARAEAPVHELRQAHRRPWRVVTSYELRYRVIAADGTAHPRSSRLPWPRSDLWSRVSRVAWQQADAGGTVEVLYLPTRPWVSRPADPGDRPTLDAAVALALGFLLAVAPAALARRRRSRSST
jgi:hypothetical protein